MTLVGVVQQILSFYGTLIIVYVLMSWFPLSGVFMDIYHALGSLIEPYLGLFRRVIPPLGAVDISPIVAILVLEWIITPLVLRLLVLIPL